MTGCPMDRNLTTLEDELLAVRCQMGDADAFDDLIRRWHEPLWRYIRRVAGNEDAAEEIAQDVWLRVVRGVARLREPARLRPWLFGIARRALMDRLRLRYAEPERASVDLERIASEDADLDIEERSARLDAGIALLPVIEREVLELFYLRELSLAEITDVLEIPQGTVKSRLHRARRMLREKLEEKGMDR